MWLRAVAIASLAALVPVAPAAAHEILHEVQRGRAVAVRIFESDGDPVAGALYEVYAPSRPDRPWQTGRTDGAGWLAFVPASPGSWRVRVIEAAGHGLDIAVEHPGPAPTPQPGASAGAPLASPPLRADATAPSGAAFVLRPLLGIAVIGVVFSALYLAWRKRGPRPGP
jgi:nickel transport protein